MSEIPSFDEINQRRKHASGTRRASPLPIAKRRQIAQFWDRNPKWSAEQVAAYYNCSAGQVRNYARQYKEGILGTPSKKKKKVATLMAETDTDELLREQLKTALCELTSQNRLTAEQRTLVLRDLVNMRKTMQQVELTNHLRRADADFIAWLIRTHLMPGATDDEIVTFYRVQKERYDVEAV
jgi:transposase-like protein